MQSLHLPPASNLPLQQRVSQQKNYLPLLCDVRIRSTVLSSFKTALAHFHSVDIIVNCSTYGIIGACEDQSESDIHQQFETNFMGTLNIIQVSLPYFRKAQAGRYVIFNGTSGALGLPGLGPYCATKYAVEGLIESMLYEVESFGVKATLVTGGPMRRDEDPDEVKDESDADSQPPQIKDNWNKEGTAVLSDTQLQPFHNFIVRSASDPYASATSPASHFKRTVQWIGDKQPTSAIKSAELVWQLGHCAFPPLRLPLGNYAVESIRDRLRSVLEEVEDWKHLNFAATGVEIETFDVLKEHQESAWAGGEDEDGEPHDKSWEDGVEAMGAL
jgi:NAD(P)-dependent dehydrogenase (short-subunit alcohol dehydrogenase family)